MVILKIITGRRKHIMAKFEMDKNQIFVVKVAEKRIHPVENLQKINLSKWKK